MPSADRRRQRPWYHDLLEDEEDPVQAVVDRVLDSPQAAQVVEGVRDFIDRAARAIEQPPHEPPRPRRPRARRIPPPRRAPRPNPLSLARTIMHFGATEPLTQQKISKRRRELAAITHPDKGGSTQAMAQLNRAAELLIQSLK